MSKRALKKSEKRNKILNENVIFFICFFLFAFSLMIAKDVLAKIVHNSSIRKSKGKKKRRSRKPWEKISAAPAAAAVR